MTIIRELRRARNMTQKALAEAVGVSQGSVAQWEIGLCKPSVDNLVALANLFGCTVDDLLRS